MRQLVRAVRLLMHTQGEKAFAELLTEREMPFQYEPTHDGRLKRPDFVTLWNDRDCFFDVKDHEGGADDFEDITPQACAISCISDGTVECDEDAADDEDLSDVGNGGTRDPYSWIREQVNQGCRKFREFKGSVCAIVMFPAGGFASDLEDPGDVLGAMYGDLGFGERWNRVTNSLDGRLHPRFLGRGKVMRPNWREPQNTTLSALITIRRVRIGEARWRKLVGARSKNEYAAGCHVDRRETHLGVIVWENVFAAIPLPMDMFRGAFDERWGQAGSRIRRVYAGNGIVELESLA